MTKNRGYKAALGLALLLGAGAVGLAGAQGMQGMMGGSMHGGGKGGVMQDCPMMGGDYRGMQGMMGGAMHGGGQGRMGMHGRMMQGGGMGMHGGMMQGGAMDMYGGMGLMRRLDLDEEQQIRLRERRSEHRHQQFSRMAEMMDLRDEMHALMHSERPDPDAVRELHGRMAELHGDMMADRIRLRNEMQDMLTDEQREQMRERRGGMGGDRGGERDHQRHHGSGS